MKIKKNKSWFNTIKKYGGNMPYYALPESLKDLSDLVKKAESEQKRIKAVGSGHSYSDVAVPETYLVNIKKLNKQLPLEKSKLKPEVDQPENLVNIEAGITVQKFNKLMDKQNLCVANMGGIDNQTLAGAISTGTHGTGLGLPSFPGLVRSVLLVTNGGKYVRIEPTDGITNPNTHDEKEVELIQNDDDFYSAVLGLGCFGIIYSFILKMETMYYLEESKECINWSYVKPRLVDRSLFNDTEGNAIRGVMVQLNPYKNKDKDHTCIVVRHKLLAGKPKRSLSDATRNWISSILSSIPISYWVIQFIIKRKAHKLPGTIDSSLKSLRDKRYENKGYKVLYQGAEYIKLRAYDCEFAFDMTNNNHDFINAVEELFKHAEENAKKGLYQSSPLGFRFVDQSSMYLSPEYGKQVAYLDTPFVLNTVMSDEILAEYQEIMLQHNGIPHWGKINTVLNNKLDEIKSHYPKLKTWEEMFQKYNPNKTFSNAFTDRLKLGSLQTV